MNQIELTPDYGSSLISGYGYDEASSTLAIQFRANGDVWHYGGCSPDMYEAFANSDSKGKYFHASIKKNLQGKKAS